MIRHRAVMDAVRDAIFLADCETGMIVDANPAAEALVGRTLSELRSLHHTELHPPENRENVQRGFAEHVRNPGVRDRSVLHKDGRRIPVEISTSHFTSPDGRPLLIGVFRDITESSAAREALRRSEERLRQVAEAAGAFVWEVDSKGLYLYANQLAEQILGYTPEEIVGKLHFYDLFVPETRGEMKAAAFEVFGRREPFRAFLNWNVRKDGAVVALETTGTPVLDADGTLLGYRGADTDVTERMRTEAALRESEERFRNMADTAPVMIWVSGPDKLCTFFNKPWLDFTGRILEHELGDGWAAGVHPEDLERCLATYSSSFDAQRSFRVEYRLRRADGQYRWIIDHGIPRYREGEFTGYIGSCIDVTERKLMEDRLRANEAQLKDAQRLAKVGSWELDVAADSIRWSDEMFRIFGLTDETPSNFSALLNRLHPNDRQKLLETDHKVRSSPGPAGVEYRILRPDGEVRFVRSIIEAIRNDRGALVRIVGATQDITEEVKARELLRESEQRLKTAERMTHVGNWTWDIKTNHVAWSEEIFRIFGRPENYAPSFEGFLEAIAPHDRTRTQEAIQECIAARRGGSIELQVARPGGELRTITCTSEILLDEEGSPALLFGACQDVTDARRVQAESFARQKLESVGTLAGGIAHDFNNLLGGVLAQVELAQAELAAGSNPEDELNGIRNVALRGSEIVRELMIYAGKESEVPGLVDVSLAIEQMLELLKVLVSKHARLDTNLGRSLPAVRGSAAQIRQIVMNLVTNASEAIGGQEGLIRMTTTCTPSDRAEAISKGLADGEWLLLEVSDTGCGMTPETQARVFDPFFTTKSAGHGLGLAVVHGLVRNLGGAIHLKSEPGIGTTFQVFLPCAGASSQTTPSPAPLPESAPSPGPVATVLVVEDEDPLRQAMAKMLRKMDYEVLEAANGSSAIDLLRSRAAEIDLVLLDVTIPGPSSQEVVAQAAQLRPDLKVLLASAYSEEMAFATVRSPLVRGFIRKPFPFADLVQKLRALLC